MRSEPVNNCGCQLIRDEKGLKMVDCRLHAVAPELLEACNFITDLCDPKTDCMSDEGKIQRINEIARTAIAKAEGGKV